ncbi:MAG: CHASE2 domain-containing protein, partial [Verrucomicrobiota bacterium]|nr:CHASE2 domain-containing protein [Verrucomicrobiota bacterium]
MLGWQGFFEVVERPFYDQQVRLLAPLNPISEEIVLLTLDDESLERMRDSLGSWRWPRIVFGGVIDYCEEARSICFGLPPAPEGEQYGETHAILEEEIRAFGSLACGCRLDASELEAPILPGLSRFFLDIEDGPTASPRFSRIDLPCLEMLSGSATMGFIDHHPDSDGLVRAVLPCVRVYDYWLPSLSMAGHFSGLNGASSRVGWIDQGLGFVVGENAFYCRSDGSVLLRPSNQHYQRIPLADIFESIRAEIEGRIPSVSRGFFVGKHVLIGSTASGALGRVYQTPLPRLRDEIEISAVALDNITTGAHYYLAPAWAGALLILVSSLFCGLFFRNRRLPALIVWPVFLVLLLGIPTLIQHFAGAVLPVGAATTGSVLSAVVVGTLIWGREQRLLRMLTEAEATKQKLTDMLVHDLKNRLSPIMISLSLVRERTSVFEDRELDELLRVAERSSTGLLEQVHNL